MVDAREDDGFAQVRLWREAMDEARLARAQVSERLGGMEGLLGDGADIVGPVAQEQEGVEGGDAKGCGNAGAERGGQIEAALAQHRGAPDEEGRRG